MTSPLRTAPRSPWTASVGLRKWLGVPVEASVAEIFRATCPALPMPQVSTAAGQSRMSRTAFSKSPSSAPIIARTAAASVSMTCTAKSRSEFIGCDYRARSRGGQTVRNRPPTLRERQRRRRSCGICRFSGDCHPLVSYKKVLVPRPAARFATPDQSCGFDCRRLIQADHRVCRTVMAICVQFYRGAARRFKLNGRPWRWLVRGAIEQLRRLHRVVAVIRCPPIISANSSIRSAPSTVRTEVTVFPPATSLRTVRCRSAKLAICGKCVMQST